MKAFTGTFSDFQAAGLSKPGTVVVDEDGDTYLIGDVNVMGGVCNCCQNVIDWTNIKAYDDSLTDQLEFVRNVRP